MPSDAEGDDGGAALELDAVEHQDRQAHIVKAPGQSRAQGLARANSMNGCARSPSG